MRLMALLLALGGPVLGPRAASAQRAGERVGQRAAERPAQHATELPFDRPLVWRAGASLGMYRFVALAGTTIRARVTGGKGTSVVTLYTPAGEEMLSAEGDSAVTLEAILPLNEVYFLSVIRTDSTRPRTIGLTKTNADDLEASFAELVGFELLNDTSGAPVNRQCWLEPGKRLRYLPAADAKVSYRRIDVTRERDARKYYTVFQNDGKTMSYEVVQRFEGDSVITTTEIPGLPPREARRAVSFGVSGGFRLGRYTGYLCGARVEGPEGEATRALIARDLAGQWARNQAATDRQSPPFARALARLREERMQLLRRAP